MPDSSVRLSLKYNGEDVNGGTMPIAEVVAALQGFAGAYGKVVDLVSPRSEHELRVTAVRPGSFDINILAWLTSPQGKEVLEGLGDIAKGATYIYTTLKAYVGVKKFLKGDSYEITIGNGNTRLVVNRDGESREIPVEVIKLLQSKTIDADLKKIVAPLEKSKVDTVVITATDDDSSESVSISSEEKLFFGESTTETREDVILAGELKSNSKETLRGTFQLLDGKRCPYHYSGQNPEQFSTIYAHKGNVRINGIAIFGEDRTIKRIEITNASPIQGVLDL